MLAAQRTLSSIKEVGVFVVHSHDHYTLLRLDANKWLFQNSLEPTPIDKQGEEKACSKAESNGVDGARAGAASEGNECTNGEERKGEATGSA